MQLQQDILLQKSSYCSYFFPNEDSASYNIIVKNQNLQG